ncbi:MAG: Cellobiose transport system permease protein [Actinomycetota bacterium]|nr:Cellobiose transport system permease protein [Actinomycetota bacterium]
MRLSRFDVKFTPYLLIAPFFLLFGVFGLFPLLYNIVVSFRNWQLDEPESNGWTGFDNYRYMLEDTEMWNALYNTFGLFVISTVPQLILALVLAALLNQKLRFQTFFRMGVLLPYITPIAASTLVFGAVFAREIGLANSLLQQVGSTPVDFKADVWSSWLAIVTMVNWRWTGYWAIIFLAAMQSIPKDLYEAATVDGAGSIAQFRRITVPLLRPAILFAVVVSTIGGLQLFAEPLLFDDKTQDANGGSAHQFQTIGLYIYKTAWKTLDLGQAAAMSVGLFLFIVLITSINAWFTNRIGGRR